MVIKMSGEFFERSVVYLKKTEDDASGGVSYDKYSLSGVMIREKFAVTPEMENTSEVTLYYFPVRSTCTAESGSDSGTNVPLPRPSFGDVIVLDPDSDAETRLRVKEAGFFGGGPLDGDASLVHVRIKAGA